MSDSRSSTPAPGGANSRFVVIIDVMILLVPIALLAAGGGAFLGMTVGALCWGNESLGAAAVVGVSVAVLLVAVWAVVFVGRAQASQEEWQVHAEKLAAYFQDKKIPYGNVSPVFHLLWRLGLKVPPPPFLGAWGSFFFPFVGVFGPIVMSAAAIYWWKHPNYELWIMWVTASIFLVGVVGLGIWNMKATRSMAIELRLPAWEDYRPAPAPAVVDSDKQGTAFKDQG